MLNKEGRLLGKPVSFGEVVTVTPKQGSTFYCVYIGSEKQGRNVVHYFAQGIDGKGASIPISNVEFRKMCKSFHISRC